MEFRKDPDTGKRTSLPGDSPLIVEAQDLRIVPQDLWEAVTTRLEAISRKIATDPTTGLALHRAHRKKFLLSGLLKCGTCGGNMAIMAKDRYGCSTRKRKGTCDNATSITRAQVEGRVLASLKQTLLAPDNLTAFVAQVCNELTTHQKSANSTQKSLEKAIAALEVKITRMLDQIEDRIGDASLLHQRLNQRQEERAALSIELETLSSGTHEPFVMPDLGLPMARWSGHWKTS